MEVMRKLSTGVIEIAAGGWRGTIRPGDDLMAEIAGPDEALTPAQRGEIEDWWSEEVEPGVSRAQAWEATRAAEMLEHSPTADDVRLEARRRILAVYPEWRQLNMAARGVELVRAGESNWSPDEAAEAAGLEAAWAWIKAVRAASNAMEAAPPADYTDDAHWPEVPA